LETTTTYTSHEDDDKIAKDEQVESVSFREFETVLNDLMIKSNHGIRNVDPKVRSLNIIAKRFDIVEQNFTKDNNSSVNSLNDILDIPEFLMCSKNDVKNQQQMKTDSDDKVLINEVSRKSYGMVIDILFELISESSSDITNNMKSSADYHDTDNNSNEFTFDNVTSKYKLDFKQRVAFEIMACSYILKTLQDEDMTDNSI